MCSQPPLNRDDIEFHFQRNLSIIQSAPRELSNIGITGGEPTLLGNKLFEILREIQVCFPEILIHILTNGRLFSNTDYTKSLVDEKIGNILFGIPLHSDYAGDHDLITQVNGSFAETMKGLYNLGRYGFDIELRIVINKMNYVRLPQLSKFIYKNLPFVKSVAFMGMEYTGYAVKHHQCIWIDPIEYQNKLEEAVIGLSTWGMNVFIFNLPHCLLKPSLYPFACKSISDWKVFYPNNCDNCSAKSQCCGLFSTSKKQSEHIRPVS